MATQGKERRGGTESQYWVFLLREAQEWNKHGEADSWKTNLNFVIFGSYSCRNRMLKGKQVKEFSDK